MRKNFIKILPALLAIAMLTGCGAHGKLYGKSEVLKYMEREVPQEKFALESVEKVPDADVSTEIYTFRSEERDLEFVARNTRTSVFMDSAVYGKSIISKYVDAVHELYREDVNSILNDSGLNIDGKKIYIESYQDLIPLATYFSAADDVYKDELNYNSADWMIENPFEKYNLFKVSQSDETNGTKVNFGGIAINGTWDPEKLLDYVSFCYASAVKEGKFEDSDIPDQYKDSAHISTIHSIYINEVNLSETAYRNAKKKGLNNNSDGMYCSGYCYKLGDYIVPLNVGLTDDEYAPQMMEEICRILNLSCEVKYGRGVISWKHNGDKWEIKASEKDDEIQSFTISKNGDSIDIPYVIHGEWTSPISGTYVVGIRATDFADIFDLKMQIDEFGDCIRFEEK